MTPRDRYCCMPKLRANLSKRLLRKLFSHVAALRSLSFVATPGPPQADGYNLSYTCRAALCAGSLIFARGSLRPLSHRQLQYFRLAALEAPVAQAFVVDIWFCVLPHL